MFFPDPSVVQFLQSKRRKETGKETAHKSSPLDPSPSSTMTPPVNQSVQGRDDASMETTATSVLADESVSMETEWSAAMATGALTDGAGKQTKGAEAEEMQQDVEPSPDASGKQAACVKLKV